MIIKYGKLYITRLYLSFIFCLVFHSCAPDSKLAATAKTRLVPVAKGWASNSINTTIFRKNSLVSFKDTQFIAFYDGEARVVLGKRKIGEQEWILKQTEFKGNTKDAHNVISIIVDGAGFLHLAWDHHNNRLHYVRSLRPGSFDFGIEMSMTGYGEDKVSYPEFYKMPDGSLLFLYRDGSSGNGNLVINKYDLAIGRWYLMQKKLIDGEGKRNAYWQACIDRMGVIHLSWVWRESPDVASNHDLCYARSKDGGLSWETSKGKAYTLPITSSAAEVACSIPQGSELINQTSMTTDEKGQPIIASYWRDKEDSIPQYHVVYSDQNYWTATKLKFRKTPFSLNGAGTKKIPISRPQVLTWSHMGRNYTILLFRDEERGNRVSLALTTDLQKNEWRIRDLDTQDLGAWEPTYDTELWKTSKLLHVFVQRTEQADAEGQSTLPPQMVEILEWNSK